MTRVAVIAGESSGDRLAAGLILALKRRIPDLVVEGVAGPRMVAAGCQALYPIDRLAIMGLSEVLRHLRAVQTLRNELLQRWTRDPPDLFIGVDVPEFNLAIEEKLRKRGVRTVHYVSPQVWAWREGRLARIGRAIDLLLTVLPFEQDYYRDHGIPARFVGHPLADEIPMSLDQRQARLDLGLPKEGVMIALLPGSRRNEWHYHAKRFLQAALWCRERRQGLRFAVPSVTKKASKVFEQARQRFAPDLPVSLIDGCSQQVITAADVVLTVSGTATLETLLLRRPMVVAYRMGAISYRIARLLVKVPYISLPNLLADRALVPELIQDQVTPEKLGAHVLHWLDNPEQARDLVAEFDRLHGELRRDASNTAADAVLELLGLAPK